VFDELLYVSWRKYGVLYSITINFIEKIVRPYISILPLGEEEYELA
jgi:hypothetical protein